MRNLEPGGETLCILMLEDSSIDAELIECRLRQAGYTFHAAKATTRAEFEEQFAARKYDLILADYNLPDFDGLTALDMVRAKDRHLPFLFVSGVLGEEIAVESLHRGATDYVTKQRLDRLAPAVSRALKEHCERLSRIEAEERLQESQRLFQQMTEAMPAMVWTCNAEGRLTYWNESWGRYVGANAPASWCDPSLVHVDDLSHTSREWREALEAGRPIELECRFLRAGDGEYRWHLVRATPLNPGDGDSAWVGTCTDMHGQKLRENALRTTEKLVVIGRMAGAIAHEINNPLESMVNLLYLLRDSDTSLEPGRSLLEEADQQLFRISSITRQTLTFYRDKAVLGDIDCRTLIDETIALFRPKLRQKNVEVAVEIDGHVHLQARAGEVRQVIINLVSNAIDAVQPGGAIAIRARESLQPSGEYVLLQVEDAGHGIPETVRRQLFQPFYSTKGSLGTGLGLWVSRNIVNSHKGQIEIESRPGRTVVSVLLPAEYCGDDQERGRQSQAPAAEQTLQ